MPRGDDPVPGKHQQKCTRPVGTLGQTRRPASLSEQGGLLVAGDTRQRDFDPQRLTASRSKVAAARSHLRENGPWDLQDVEKPRIPLGEGQVVQQSSGGIRRIGRVDRPGCEPRDQPGVDRPGRQLPRFRPGAKVRPFTKEPEELRPGKVGIQHEAGALSDLRLVARLLEIGA